MSKTNEIGSLTARLTLADAILAAVKESGLLRKAKASMRGRKAAATRMRNWRKVNKLAKPVKSKGSKLAKVPDVSTAA
jgi:hypothetical protein